MHRRAILKFLSGLIAAACGAIVGIPGVRYVIETVRRREENEIATQRLVRLKDLPVGRPTQMAVTGRRRDAWTVYSQEVIGRVWLVRKTAAEDSPVQALTSICPHLGCAVKVDAGGKGFVCPCHKAAWDLSGQKVSDKQLGHKNPSPRDLDVLECSVVTDDQTGETWVEVKYEKFQHGLTTKVAQV